MIREAKIGDAPELANVHVQSWRSAYAGVLQQAYLDALDPASRVPGWEAHLRQTDWPATGTFVAEDVDTVVGFVHVCPSRDQDASASGEVASLYVLPDWWGKSFGRHLMDAALATLSRADFGQATLWVLDNNVRAIRFYRAGGWAHDGARKTDKIGRITVIEERYRRDLRGT